jgi:hypothetical protein
LAFVGNKEKLRQKIEVPSLVPLACAYMRLRVWVHNPNCVVSWPGEYRARLWLPPAVIWTLPVFSPGLNMSEIGKASPLENKT